MIKPGRYAVVLIVVVLALSSLWLPLHISLAHADTGPTVVGSNVTTCGSGLFSCSVSVAGGGTTYMYGASIGGSYNISTVDFPADVSVRNQEHNLAVLVGHSNSNKGTFNPGGALFPNIGGIGVTGTPYLIDPFSNIGQTSITENFDVPQQSLVIMVLASSNNLPGAVSAPFVVDQSQRNCCDTVMLAHANMPAGPASITVNLGQWSPDTIERGIGLVLYFFSTPSSANSVFTFAPCVNGFQVDINGAASPGSAVTSITWNWGDGAQTTGFFPAAHTYSNSGNFPITVTAHYNDGTSASASTFANVGQGVLSNCNSLLIASGRGGSVSYTASVGTGTVQAASSVTLYLDTADDLSLVANPGNGGTFSRWSVSGPITGPGGSAVPTSSSNILVVVNGNGAISAAFTLPLGNLAFKDDFSENSLNVTKWWEDSSVLSNIAASEPAKPSVLSLSQAQSVLSNPPTFGAGARWLISGVNTMFGVTTRDAFTPPFTLDTKAVLEANLNRGIPVAIFISNSQATSVFAVLLGDQLQIQDQGQIYPPLGSSPLLMTPSGQTYSIDVSIGLSQINLSVAGGGNSFSQFFPFSLSSDSAYYITLASLTGPLTGSSAGTTTTDVVYDTIEVQSSNAWSLNAQVFASFDGSTSLAANEPVTLSNAYTGFKTTVNSGSNGVASFSGLPTGIYSADAALSHTTPDGITSQFSDQQFVMIGDPQSPSTLALSTALKVQVPQPDSLSVTISPSGSHSGIDPLVESIIAAPYGGTGQYTLSWYLDGSIVSASAMSPCTPIGQELDCTFTNGTHSVYAQVQDAPGSTWFGTTPNDKPANSDSTRFSVGPATYCALTSEGSHTGGLTIGISYSTSSCQFTGQDTGIIRISGTSVALDTTISNNYPGSYPLSKLPDWLVAILGISYPYYGIELVTPTMSTDTHYVVPLDNSQPVVLSFPAGTPIDATATCSVNCLRGYSFSILLRPDTQSALVNDAVIAVLAAVGIISAIKGLQNVSDAAKHAIIDEIRDLVTQDLPQSAATVFAGHVLTLNPFEVEKNVRDLVEGLIWPVALDVLKNIGPTVASLFKIANPFGAELLAKLDVHRAVADAVFDLTAIIVTVARGPSSQDFKFDSLRAPTTVIVSDPGYVIPFVSANFGTSVYGYIGNWASPGTGLLHSPFTPSVYSFLVPDGNFTLAIVAQPNSPSNYIITLNSANNATTIGGVLQPGKAQLVQVFFVSGSIKTASISVSQFFTDGNPSLLPTDSAGNPVVNVILSNGKARSTNPGQVIAWTNLTNAGNTQIQSLKVNVTLPVDWTVHPSWLLALGGITVFFVFLNGTRLDITSQTMVTVSSGNPEQIMLSISNMTATLVGHPLGPSESILLAAKLSYALIGTSQSFSSYPRTYGDTSSASAWMQPSFRGGQASASGSALFTAYAKVLGDVNNDGVVDITDIAAVAYSFGARPGDTLWNPALDLTGSRVIDIRDIAYVAYYFGNHA